MNDWTETLGDGLGAEIAAVAARWVVEDGLDFQAAKRQAVKQMGLPARVAWPDNALMEAAVREYIALFCPEDQAQALLALRELALVWLERLAEFRPYLGGAIWHGSATRHNDIELQLFCDDPKSVEWTLMDQRLDYQVGTGQGWQGQIVPALSLRLWCEPLQQWVMLHLLLQDLDDLRGALRADAQGRSPRGDAKALRRRLQAPL